MQSVLADYVPLVCNALVSRCVLWLIVIASLETRASMFLSLHIPKTGGVSLRNILKEHFGPDFYLSYWEVTDAYGRIITEVPATARCVHGHFQADQLADRFPHARLITWVRDPVERVVSSYYHRLRDPDWRHPVCLELHARKLTLLDYAALPLVRNEMTHFFGRRQPADFSFIGVLDEFHASMVHLTTLLGMPTVPFRHDNFNPQKKSDKYDLDLPTREAISALNEKDQVLYQECLRRSAKLRSLSKLNLAAS